MLDHPSRSPRSAAPRPLFRHRPFFRPRPLFRLPFCGLTAALPAGALPLLLSIVCCGVDCGVSGTTALAAEPPTVRLVIRFGDGVEKHFTGLPHENGMTGLDALEAARAHRRGIAFKHRGRGATAFLTSIDGLENQGASGRNWVYRVNGKLGQESFAVRKLAADDEIAWSFEVYP